MWKNPQFPADLVTFTEKKSLMVNFIFCAVSLNIMDISWAGKESIPVVNSVFGTEPHPLNLAKTVWDQSFVHGIIQLLEHHSSYIP